MIRDSRSFVPLLLLVLVLCSPAKGQDAEALAKAAQNPIAAMISVPFQYNANLDAGPAEQTQHVLNIQPVIPVSLNAEWNLITRTIVPLISQPDFGSGAGRENGLGDIQFSAFFSPAKPKGAVWGVGAVIQAPSATDDRLGSGKWAAGPTGVVLAFQGPWVYGALINHLWDFAGSNQRGDVNQTLVQPFVNYNFPAHPGRYLSFSPIITANWEASSSNTWTIPLGIAIGQIFKIGTQPVNGQLGAYYSVERPDGAPRWNIRAQLQLLFPR